MHAAVTGYVLAGGRSSRMGRDKALIEVDGSPLIAGALERLRAVCAQVAILSGPADLERDAILSRYARLVPDVEPGSEGPLAGLDAALADCPTDYALLLAVDQPAVTVPHLSQLADLSGSGALAACFGQNNRDEVLPMLVHCSLAVGIREQLRAGERRLLVAARACAGERFVRVNTDEDCFANLNTPQDLASLIEQGLCSP